MGYSYFFPSQDVLCWGGICSRTALTTRRETLFHYLILLRLRQRNSILWEMRATFPSSAAMGSEAAAASRGFQPEFSVRRRQVRSRTTQSRCFRFGPSLRGFAASPVYFISIEYQLVFSGRLLRLGEIHLF